MKRICIFLLAVGLYSRPAIAQTDESAAKPRLVVGIVVDQMRQEYLYRFYNKFGDRGFKRFMKEGFMLQNAHYNYVPTYTGPGHASIYTGSTPSFHGIIGNDWYDRATKAMVNCVEDKRDTTNRGEGVVRTVSPWRMLATTVTDELKIATQKKSRVVGVSLKDRGAVLPAGHLPDGAYWFDSKSGNFVTSNYYVTALPDWARKFNALKLAEKFLDQDWTTLLPINQYKESGPDDSPYETTIKEGGNATFPYPLRALKKSYGFELLSYTPFGDDMLTEMAKAAIDGEEMGKDEVPDFLTVSFSTPDILGHSYGPNSVEIEDVYVRLDKNLEDLFAKLDKDIGAGMYVVFLTSDHGVVEVPQSLKDIRIPAGYFDGGKLASGLSKFLQQYYPGKTILEKISNGQIFLRQDVFSEDPKSAEMNVTIVSELISKYVQSLEGVSQVFTRSNLLQGSYGEVGVKGKLIRGFNIRRSGDVVYVLEPGWVENLPSQKGTTHGTGYTYDTHVPVLFYGFGVNHGVSSMYHSTTDIAPTVSTLLKIKFPNSCTGQPIVELLK